MDDKGILYYISPGGIGVTTLELFNDQSHINTKFTINDFPFPMPIEVVSINYSDKGARIGF